MPHSRIEPETSTDLTALKAEFEARGFYTKPTGKILFQLALHLLTAAAGIGLWLSMEGFWWKGLAVVIFCLGATGLATNTHTSAHYATSSRRWLNRTLTYLGFSFLLGLGATYWWNKHNVLHHAGPNVIGVDEDCRFTPWFAFSQADIPSRGFLARRYYRAQWLGLPIAASLTGIQLQFFSFSHLFHELRKRRGLSRAHQLDLTLLVSHWTVWVGFPLLLLPWTDVLTFTLLRLVILGIILFIIFAPGHVPAEAAVVQVDGRGRDNFLLQTSNSLNFRTGPIGAWLCSGLQYQVEHHLFPSISHVHYPKMSNLVAEFCERNGYPYRTLGWDEALWKTVLNFVRPKQVSAKLERIT